ncbi:MAG: hypothetical protein ACD_63C00004G0002 [uncultured bacterium]|nr:MAG: hypothetical protein ACD_63C00004G0002 [uncultured bacterium]
MAKVPIEISARHMHLSQNDLEALFGEGYRLEVHKKLSQADEFASKDKVTIRGASEEPIEGVRVVGPVREKTQVEVSHTEARLLGTKVPLRISGDLESSAPVKIIGPNGEVDLVEGMIVAKRHIHLSLHDSEKLGIQDGQDVSVKIGGKRGLVFDNIEARVSEGYKKSVHLDTDEGNAAGISGRSEGKIVIGSNR